MSMFGIGGFGAYNPYQSQNIANPLAGIPSSFYASPFAGGGVSNATDLSGLFGGGIQQQQQQASPFASSLSIGGGFGGGNILALMMQMMLN